MSSKDYYHAGQPEQGGYAPQGGPTQGGYYPQQPPQTYAQQPPQSYGQQAPYPQQQQQPYYPQPGYGQPQPQNVYVQQEKSSGSKTGCMACLAGICLCCCAEEICDCIF